jgi:hypothetical protein
MICPMTGNNGGVSMGVLKAADHRERPRCRQWASKARMAKFVAGSIIALRAGLDDDP